MDGIKKMLVRLAAKAHRMLTTLLLSLFAVLIVLIIRVSGPFRAVRLGSMRSERLGHFAANTELYLCERDLGMHGGALDIFYMTRPIANEQLKNMWLRTKGLRIFPFGRLAYIADKLNRLFPGWQRHVVKTGDRDIEGMTAHIRSHLFFSREEEEMGRRALEVMGIAPDDRFVCFHARDSAYLNAAFPHVVWDYHNYRDCNIHNYQKAIKELTARGYYALRMGSVVKEPLYIQDKRFIDYAVKYRKDFLDIYLPAKCSFFLGTSDGIASVPFIFRRPVALVNLVPLSDLTICGPGCLFIPKKMRFREKGRFMTYREILASGAGRFYKTADYLKAGIDLVENTPEEISDLAMEMDERVKGTWKPDKEDEELKKMFGDIFREAGINKGMTGTIGAAFLRKNTQLLG